MKISTRRKMNTGITVSPSGRISNRLMRLLTFITLMAICLTALGQTSLTKKVRWARVDSFFTKDGKKQTGQTSYPYAHIDTEFKYVDSSGKGVIIQNSVPRAGGDADEKCRYTDSAGRKYRYAIFWTRVINETATRVELTINFPAILPTPYAHVKLFLPADTMTIGKESLYNYGITGLKSYLDTDFTKTKLQRTINPNGECLFYIVLLSPLYHEGGTLRTRFILKGQDLFYRISILPNFDSALFSCGKIAFKKQ